MSEIPTPIWNRRDYQFEKLKVGDWIEQSESIPYSRSAASVWYKLHNRQKYTTSTSTVNGVKTVRLTRIA